ncbi:hypothetical protein [Chondromyces crocatus]|nr:hypothetical protein [Chondromyces crocatus]
MIARWDLLTDEITAGARLRGTVYPRRCDLSPDGRLLYAFLLKTASRGFLGSGGGLLSYSIVSKLPWLYALAAWKESGTWTRGYHFVERQGRDEPPWDIGPPGEGDVVPLRARYGLARTEPFQYAAEHRRGWTAHERCPARGPNDMWDERRQVVLVRTRPGGSERLVLTDTGLNTARPFAIEGRRPDYHLERRGREVALPDVTWADWDARGRLLLATSYGCLQIRDVDKHPMPVRWERDLEHLPPAPGSAPEHVRRW